MSKRMSNNNGFTLIELLIALIVIGMIVSLLVGLFGNPVAESSVKQAATKIADDMRSTDDAAQQMLTNLTRRTTGYVHGGVGADADAAPTALVNAAMLKAKPVPPSQAVATPGTDVYAFDKTMTAWGDAAKTDTVVKLTNVTDDVCKKVNELFGGLAAGANIPAGAVGTKDIQCFGTVVNENTVVKPIFVDYPGL